MGPNDPQDIPHPVDFLLWKMRAIFSVYDHMKKIPENCR
jgi:hypothetical protein